MNKFLRLSTAIVGIAAASVVFAAQNQPNQSKGPSSAQTLEQLLHHVRQQQSQQAKLNNKREQRFEQQRDKQKQILANAKDKLNAAQAQGKKLQNTFDANEKALDNLNTQLHSREGNLGEAFGVVRQVAGNVKGTVNNSLISAQLPNSKQRSQLLTKLSNSQSLPSIKQLEKLWYIMQQQMTMQGQVAKFSATITQSDGTKKKTQVVRVGVFDAISGNNFLRFLPENDSLVTLPRQPAGRYQDMAGDLASASSGRVRMAVDPTSGSLLGLLIQKPTLSERINQGGYPGYTVLALGALGLLIIIERAIYLLIVGRKMKSQLAEIDEPRQSNPLGRVLGIYNANRAEDPETLELRLDEAIMQETPKLEARLYIVKLIAAIAPLLGLLGTVIGMVVTFQSITLFGTGNPKLMANGISQALVTTIEGLVVAIPLVLLHGLISRRSQGLVEVLEQQSAGLVAERAERERGVNTASSDASSRESGVRTSTSSEVASRESGGRR